MLLISLALAADLDLAALRNTDLVTPKGNDAWCGMAPGTVFPVGQAAGALRFRWTGDAGMNFELNFADGVRTKATAERSTDIGAPGGPSEGATPVELGTDAAGKPVLGAEWVLPTGRPSTVLTSITLNRAGPKRVCITSIVVEAFDLGLDSDTSTWYPFPIGSMPQSPYPIGLPVEAPAGKRGAVKVNDVGNLVYADGTRARFWGVDLYTQNALPPKDRAERYAMGLRAMGVNMVRLHHIDLDTKGVLNPKRADEGQPTFDAEALDRLDFFVAKLQEQGIYLFLEFSTFRRLLTKDGVSGPGFAPGGHKLLPMWLPDWEAAYVAHVRGVWDRKNPYTGRRYADDPAVAIVELSNEHSITLSWGGQIHSLPDVYRDTLAERFRDWLKQRYTDDAALAAAWSCTCAHPGLATGESLSGKIRLDPENAGVGAAWPEQRRADLLRFYADLERSFYLRLTDTARKMGFTQVLSPTLSFGRLEVAALQETAQLHDQHISWDQAAGFSSLKNVSWLADPWAERTIEAAGQVVAGRAVSVSELNHPFPNRYEAEGPWSWAMFASVQDWDILIWNDLQLRDDDTSWVFAPSDLSAMPLKMVQFASASSAFRGGWIPAASGYAPLYWTPAAVDAQRVGRWSAPFATSDIASLLTARVRAVLGGPMPTAVPGQPHPGIGWWSDPGLMVLDLPKLRVRIGPPATTVDDGVGPVRVPGLEVETEQWSAVALTSADGADLSTSRKAVLTVATRQQLTGQRMAEAGRRWLVRGALPVKVEPFQGRIRFAFAGTPRVTRLSHTGAQVAPVKVTKKGQLWELTLDATVQSPIFLVEGT